MEILRGYKTELAPNNQQRSLFVQYAGTARYVFNWALADRQQRYEDGLKTSMYEQSKRFNANKDEWCPWIRQMPYAITESAIRNCDAAFKHFFRRVKAGETPGYPKFKSRHKRKAFQIRGVKVEHDRVRLTGAGWIRLKERGYIPQDRRQGIYSAVSERAGRWFISVLVYHDVPDTPNDSMLIIGVDLGLKTLVVLSNGETFENPHCLIKAERKLKRLQREQSRRKKGSANWHKTKANLARQHAKVANIRRHILHDISHHITAELRPRTIVLENLNVSGMIQNHHLAKAIADVGFYELRRQIEYKAKRYGIEVVIADRWYASSKLCSDCGHKNVDLTLADRVYTCPECGLEIDRDLNAALNLAALKEPSNGRGLPVELECSKALL
jgi:putative transposase